MANVLVVEDNEESRCMLQALLEGYGHKVVAAENGAHGLKLAHSQPPDLVVSDILMPVMDGYALCRAWKHDDQLSRIPFVFYTATYTLAEDKELARRLGADRFLIKPLDPDAWEAIIEDLLSQAGSGGSPSVQTPELDDTVYLRDYNQTLVRKLESKLRQLAETNRQLNQKVQEVEDSQAALRESEGRFRTIFETAVDGIVLVDEELLEIVDFNQAAHESLGYSREEFAGLRMGDIVHGFGEKELRACCAAMRESRTSPCEATLRAKDGGRREVSITASPAEFHGRSLLACIVRDVTERNQLLAQLQRSQRLEAVGRLAGGVAHDFNNLLTVILGHSELMLDELAPESPAREGLTAVQETASRAAALTRQLLAFSSAKTAEPHAVQLNETIVGMERMMAPLIGEDVKLTTRLEEGVGSVFADASDIERIIVNLVANARDAMPEGGEIFIETSAVSEPSGGNPPQVEGWTGRYVELVVRDTGAGMPEQVRQHIFDPFYTTKEQGKGTGLGMATVYGVVHGAGGSVEVENGINMGATVRVRLPEVRITAPVVASRAASADATVEERTILLVEDDDAVRAVIRRILQQAGYRVIEAENADAALAVVPSLGGEVDLLLTDVNMPGRTGPELASELVQLIPELRVLLMCGYAEDAALQQGIERGEVAMLNKPFSPRTLLERTHELLS